MFDVLPCSRLFIYFYDTATPLLFSLVLARSRREHFFLFRHIYRLQHDRPAVWRWESPPPSLLLASRTTLQPLNGQQGLRSNDDERIEMLGFYFFSTTILLVIATTHYTIKRNIGRDDLGLFTSFFLASFFTLVRPEFYFSLPSLLPRPPHSTSSFVFLYKATRQPWRSSRADSKGRIWLDRLDSCLWITNYLADG